ncbi:hypothetical protein [Kribbella sp. NPDC006257]|uniref:hypothetical protein n=1 Tax=Kribbella sp. NPDC006257 TaxID=3156738 RepID=UPI0033A632BC
MAPPRNLTYVDRQGHPITRTTWLRLSSRPEYVAIASDTVALDGEQVQVMTIWLGLKLPIPEPPIFETLAQPSGSSQPQRWTWSNLNRARTGHHRIVNELTAQSLDLDQSETITEPLTETG